MFGGLGWAGPGYPQHQYQSVLPVGLSQTMILISHHVVRLQSLQSSSSSSPPSLHRGKYQSLRGSDQPVLSPDPRCWTRQEVSAWVEWTLSSHNLPSPSVDRFLMNGKAVCLMSVQMFSNRVPLGGKLLYRDFQIRLAKAMSCKV